VLTSAVHLMEEPAAPRVSVLKSLLNDLDNACGLSEAKAPRSFDYNDVEIWCDKNSDRALLTSWKDASSFLAKVKKIGVLPNNAEIRRSAKFEFIRPLVKYDRADFFIFYRQKPVLLVELTEHGYTGDNSLQRFARLASAGEEGIPVLYFTPFSRTRIDEVEATDEKTSKRHVSLNLFNGAERIRAIHGVPVMLLDWRTDAHGLPATVDARASPEQKLAIYGQLIGLIEHIVTKHFDEVGKPGFGKRCPKVESALSMMKSEAKKIALRESEVKVLDIPFAKISEILRNPSKTIDLLDRNYFFKGKDHKLIALLALMKSKIKRIETTSGEMLAGEELLSKGIAALPDEIKERPSVVYFCGYEKRSEPNGGIIVNVDYLYCRTGKTVKDRKRNLIVIWPRVFYDSESTKAVEIITDIKRTVSGKRDTQLAELMKEKLERIGGRSEDHRYIQATESSVGFWKENDTIGVICRSFCDLLILNDAVLLGEHWINRKPGGSLDTWMD
jgi:hypothetical protein